MRVESPRQIPSRPPKMAQVDGRVSAKPDAAICAVESLRQIRPPAENGASRRSRFCKTGRGLSTPLNLRGESSLSPAEKWRKSPVALMQNRTRLSTPSSLRVKILSSAEKCRRLPVELLQNRTRPVCAVESPRQILPSARGKMAQVAGRVSAKPDAASLRR